MDTEIFSPAAHAFIDQTAIDRIAAALHARISQQVPIEYQLWDAEMVSGYLCTSLSNFQQYIAPHQKFPRPVKVPNTKGQKMQSRWMAMDVIAYMDDCKDR